MISSRSNDWNQEDPSGGGLVTIVLLFMMESRVKDCVGNINRCTMFFK